MKKWEEIEAPSFLETELLTRLLEKEKAKKKEKFKIFSLPFPIYRIPAPVAWAALILFLFLSFSFTKDLFSPKISTEVEVKKIESKLTLPNKIVITANDIKSTTTTYQTERR